MHAALCDLPVKNFAAWADRPEADVRQGQAGWKRREGMRMGLMDMEEMGGVGKAPDKETISEADVNNLMYEIESAHRQIASLQKMLAGKTREVAALQEQLIEREVLLKQAAVCIGEAMELCKEQAAHTDGAQRLFSGYEEEWRTLQNRLDRMREQMPEVPAARVRISGTGSAMDGVRSAVNSSVRQAEESLRRIFEEE